MIALHHKNYRKEDIKVIAKWIKSSQSGVILGVNGVGKSNFFQYLTTNQKDIYKKYQKHFGKHPFLILTLDLNYMPDERASTLPRMMLRAFYEARVHLGHSLQRAIQHNYDNHFLQDDVLVSWTAIKDILLHFKDQKHKVVFLLDRFEEFPNFATQQMLNNLRGLRDNFKRTLSYLVSMGNDDSYQTDPEMLGEFHELIDINHLWLKPLTRRDTEHVIKKRTYYAKERPTSDEIELFIELSGGYPALLVAICRWWQKEGKTYEQNNWEAQLFKQTGVSTRLRHIWESLTRKQVENLQNYLVGVKSDETEFPKLKEIGILDERTETKVIGTLLHHFIQQTPIREIVIITQHEVNGDFFKNGAKIEFTELEQRLFEAFFAYPEEKLTHYFLITQTWPKENASNESLQQLIRGIRVKIEENPSKPKYIVTARGTKYTDGGYIFYPEGEPKAK